MIWGAIDLPNLIWLLKANNWVIKIRLNITIYTCSTMNFGGAVDLDFANDEEMEEESEIFGSVLVPGTIIILFMRLSLL